MAGDGRWQASNCWPAPTTLAALTVTFFLQSWNSYLWPRLVANRNHMLLVYLVFQRQISETAISAGIKG